jgi:hypothetical protein
VSKAWARLATIIRFHAVDKVANRFIQKDHRWCQSRWTSTISVHRSWFFDRGTVRGLLPAAGVPLFAVSFWLMRCATRRVSSSPSSERSRFTRTGGDTALVPFSSGSCFTARRHVAMSPCHDFESPSSAALGSLERVFPRSGMRRRDDEMTPTPTHTNWLYYRNISLHIVRLGPFLKNRARQAWC